MIPIWGFPKKWVYLFGGPHSTGYNILGSILGSPYFGNLPYNPYIITIVGRVLQCSPSTKPEASKFRRGELKYESRSQTM